MQFMSRVAAIQAKSVEARKRFVYKQEQLIALRFTNGKTACQMKREYTVVPNSIGVTRKLVKSESIIGHCDDDSNKNVTANIDDSTAESMALRRAGRRTVFRATFSAYGEGAAPLRIPAARH